MVIIEKLSKSFGDHLVLDEVSLKVEEAENLVVFGRSGTGKSVLLKCMVRLMQPNKGDVSIFGKNVMTLGIDELNDLRQQMGFLFQGAALYDSMSVRGNLDFPLIRHSNLTLKERERRIKDVLEKVSLEEAIDKMPADLSGGMKKRIGLARAIITEPKLMLYDEPTTGLDPITAKEISKLILDLQKELKMTSVIVTHDILCAKIIADRAVMLEDGKIQYTGDITELTTSKDPFLKNFFSDELIEESGRKG
jgi:phospholipid/cholesterol/gamma-HCH transport system ATP-binding protein